MKRLSTGLAERDGLSWTLCHGDCNGYNANIALQGPRAGQAVFYDFDEGGPGYLAYDIAVFLHCCVMYEKKQHAFWHAFMDGYRSIREVPQADFEAVNSSFRFVICGLSASTPAVSTNGVARPCPPIGSPRSWISCCRGKRRSWRWGCSEQFLRRPPTAPIASELGWKKPETQSRSHQDRPERVAGRQLGVRGALQAQSKPSGLPARNLVE